MAGLVYRVLLGVDNHSFGTFFRVMARVRLDLGDWASKGVARSGADFHVHTPKVVGTA